MAFLKQKCLGVGTGSGAGASVLFPHSHFMSQSYYHGCGCGRTSHTFVWAVCENISCNKRICTLHNFLWFNSSVYLLLTLGYPQSAKAVLPCILDMDLEGMQVRYQT